VSRRTSFGLLIVFLLLAFTLTHVPIRGDSQIFATARMIPAADKWVHGAIYFVLAGLKANCLRFWVRGNGWIALWTMVLVLTYAALDEWSQGFVPTRSPSFYDFLADAAGAALGVTVFVICRTWRQRVRSRRRADLILV